MLNFAKYGDMRVLAKFIAASGTFWSLLICLMLYSPLWAIDAASPTAWHGVYHQLQGWRPWKVKSRDPVSMLKNLMGANEEIYW